MYSEQPQIQQIHNSRYYQPLFNTLEKSRVGVTQNQISRTTNNMINMGFGAQSRIATNIRSLSPQQAQIIRRETIIPADKELVPTNNLWKVRGKQFTAVDIQVKEGAPIPSYLINQKRNKVPAIEQTVYELKPKNGSVSYRPFSPPYVNRVSRVSRVASPAIEYQTQRVASPVRVLETPTFKPNLNFPLKAPIPLQVSSNKKSRLTDSNEHLVLNGSKSSQREPIGLLNQKKKGKSYKYNLFSSIDEFVNSGCHTCGSNQIVATKPQNQSWI